MVIRVNTNVAKLAWEVCHVTSRLGLVPARLDIMVSSVNLSVITVNLTSVINLAAFAYMLVNLGTKVTNAT